MELNKYQEEALDRFGLWLDALDEERTKSENLAKLLEKVGQDIPEVGNYPKKAWDAMLGKVGQIPVWEHVDRCDSAGRPIPHACFKIPTGGGKTLMAAAALECLRLQTGLVLWVVPTMRIYEQTKAALRNRNSPIRQRLDRGSGGRVRFMEKDDAFNRHDVEQRLCVMLLSLAAANRDENPDFLRMNRDSSVYRSLFPDVDDAPGNAGLLKDHPGLALNKDGTVKHSLANVIRIMRPVVVLDEAHKAYRSGGREYAGMINQLNPRLVVEMSATPNPGISNLLVDVSGNDLWKEEMIKMPIILDVQTDPDWKHLLDVVHTRLGQLEDDARSLHSENGRYVRPIALVRVERTGRSQRDGRHIHADDARDYLMHGLAIPPEHIAVQSSEQKDLEDVDDLLSEAAQIRWIITKDAIKEGWDCPFAYVLAILDNIKTHTSVTQLLGRVLRQPDARRTGVKSLDQCYAYCHNSDTGKMAEYVRQGLSEIGMGDMARTVKSDNSGRDSKTITKRQKKKDPIFLPLVLHKDEKDWTELEYERHILSSVNFTAMSAPDPSNFEPTTHGWKRMIIRPNDVRSDDSKLMVHGGKSAGVSDFARPLTDVIPNVWQAARIAGDFLEKLRAAGRTETDIYDGRMYLVKVLRDHVTEQVKRQAGEVFRDKMRRGDIRFDLQMEDHNYHVRTYEVEAGKLLAVDGEPAQRTLFEPVYEEEFDTNLELCFARYLDSKATVDWWHRVAARQKGGYRIRGWTKDSVYPDFIVMTNRIGDVMRLGMYDTKGDQLKDHPDTEYKRDLLKTLEDAFNCGTVTVRGNRLRGEFRLVFKDKFEEILT